MMDDNSENAPVASDTVDSPRSAAPIRQADVIDIEVHPKAQQFFRERIDTFAATLLLESKLVARRRKADSVQSTHVDEALDNLRDRQRPSSRKQLALAIGSALLGIFTQDFFRGMGDNWVISAWTVIMGLLGWFLVMYGIFAE